MDKVKLMIADDHRLFSEALMMVLKEVEEVEIIGLADNGVELINLISHNTPDIVILDINMPEMDGIECCKQIKKLNSDIKIMILSSFYSEEFVLNAMHNGADIYLSKCSNIESLKEAILDVVFGEQCKTSEFNNVRSSETFDITQREKEILKLIALGHTANQIANDLCLSLHTVETHRKNLRNKLGLKNQSMLVKYAIERGLV